MNDERALLLLFPHDYIVWGLCEEQKRIGADFDLPKLKLAHQVRKLRTECGRTYLVVVKFGQMQLPLDEAFSPQPSDVILDSGAELRREWLLGCDPNGPAWQPEKPNFAPIIQPISEPEVIIGGFHFVDCVFGCEQAAYDAGKRTWIAPWATDHCFVHHGLEHLGRQVLDVDDIPELIDLDIYVAILQQYHALSYPDD